MIPAAPNVPQHMGSQRCFGTSFQRTIFLVMPAVLRHGIEFRPTLATRCALTFALYLVTTWENSASRFDAMQ
jgi:hypothetical protein